VTANKPRLEQAKTLSKKSPAFKNFMRGLTNNHTLSDYTRVFGEKHKIISLLKDENVQQYVKSELGKEQSVDEFSKLVSKLGPQIIEEIQNDITIKDHSLNRWLKHIIDDEIS